MDSKELTTKAEELARKYHADQVDLAGKPYIEHLERVVRGLGHRASEEQKQVAWLHDIIEDCPVTADDLRKWGFSDEVVDAVVCLSKTGPTMPYMAYCRKVKQNPLARSVKLVDLIDNSDLNRLGGKLTQRDRERLEKYRKAMMIIL